jgi:malonate transporter
MVIAYGLGSLLMVALTLAFTRFVQRRDLLTGAVFSMGTAMANSSFVGFPIALQLFGPQAGAALAAYAVVESVVMFPLLYVLGDAAASGRQPLPVLLSQHRRAAGQEPLFAQPRGGGAWAASGVALPAPIGRAVGMLASTSAPVALFCIGGTLAGLSLQGHG